MTHRKNDTDLISAYLDGELSWTERLRVFFKRQTQPGFRRQLRENHQLEDRYLKQIQRIDDQPLPESLQQLLGTTPQPPVNAPLSWSTRVLQMLESVKWQPASALALCLLLVTGLIVVRPDSNHTTLLSQLQQSIHSEPLKQTFSGDSFESELGTVQVILAFETDSGEPCKLLSISGSTTAQSVFCRTDNDWAVAVAEPVNGMKSGRYQLADDGLADSVAAFINANISGNVMTPKEEAALR